MTTLRQDLLQHVEAKDKATLTEIREIIEDTLESVSIVMRSKKVC